MSKREKPEEIPMTEEELKDLLARIKEKKLEDQDYETLTKLIHFVVWMQMKLQSARMTMRKFRDMIFGCKTEKRKKKKKDDNESGQDKAVEDEDTAESVESTETNVASKIENSEEHSSMTDTSMMLNQHGEASNDTDLPRKKGH